MPSISPVDRVGYLRGRWRSDALVALGVLTLAAGAVAGLALVRPATLATTKADTYTQSGQLSYGAPVSPTSIYGTTRVTTGQPVYRADVSTLSLEYSYQMRSSTVGDIRGTEQLVATVSNGQGITRSLDLQAPTPFRGERFEAAASLSLAWLDQVAAAFDRAGDRSAGAYIVDISPSVRIQGRAGGSPFAAAFDAPVALTYDSGTLTAGSANAGVPSAAGSASLNPLLVATVGSVPVPSRKANTLFLHLPVSQARGIGLAVLLTALVVGGLLARSLRRDALVPREAQRIQARYGPMLIEAKTLPDALTVGVDLASMEDLVRVAEQLQAPLLHAEGLIDTYGVIDSGTMYTYRTDLGEIPLPESEFVRNQSFGPTAA